MELGYFYQRRVPDAGELVMARVESIDDVGISCRLLEYNNMEALLPMTEVSKKRLRSIRKVINVGNVKVLQVLRSDRQYVDLSKKHLDREAIEIGTEKYEKGKHAISMIRQLAEVAHRSLDELCDEILWPLYLQHAEDGPHPYHVFRKLSFEDSEIPEELREPLKKIVQQRIVTKELKIGATIELTCYTSEGIDAIKAAVKTAMTDFPGVQLRYISAPTYQVSATGVDGEEIVKQITTAIGRISEEITDRGGHCHVLTAPTSIADESDEE